MTERKSISPKIRFEVFKRDGFTCQYCGRKTPDTILEVDHIIPVVEGGSNELENLVTSCFECNRGKGASLLDERTPVTDVHEQTLLIAEREMQLLEYNFVREKQRERENLDICQIHEYWDEQFNGYAYHHPQDSSLRYFLKHLSKFDIMDAIEITSRKQRSTGAAVGYLYGILHNWIRDRTQSQVE